MNEIYKLIDWLFEFYKNKIIFSRQITCSLSKEKYDVRVENNRIVPYCPYIREGDKCEVPITSADGVDKQNKKRTLRGNKGKCYIANKKHYGAICFLLIILFFVIFLLFLVFIKERKVKSPQGDSAHKVIGKSEEIIQGVSYFNRQTEPLKLGQLKIGGEMPGGPGDTTFAPYMKIPISKFYVSVMEPNSWCINEDCNLDGAFIQTMGGWLEVNHTGDPTLDEFYGLDLPENKNIKSLVLIGDRDGKIVGIYPSRGLDDVIPILKLHPDLADFNLLKGVDEFGSFKIGELAPLKPGDSIIHLSDKLVKFSPNIPKDKKFYLYALQKRKYKEVGMYNGMYEAYENKYICSLSGCRYPEPDPPHDFLYADIDELGGWFLSNDQSNSEMVKLFGLDQEEVLAGKSSLVILTDSKGVIRAIHPNKTMSDALTILSQHPDLADVVGWYGR
ncbi:MAG: hypothetical protein V1655_01655 [bacterium]